MVQTVGSLRLWNFFHDPKTIVITFEGRVQSSEEEILIYMLIHGFRVR